MVPARSVRGIACAAGVLVAGASIWSGCSVEKNYELLSFFFDGVPNPNAPQSTLAGGSGAAMRDSPTYTVHPPFAEARCDACHKSMFDRTGIGAEVCQECHAGTQDEFAMMHGPVSVGACLWCHVPHQSAYAHLLKRPERETCTQCHRSELLNHEVVAEHADETRGCLECHVGHGSDARYLLRDHTYRPVPAEEG